MTHFPSSAGFRRIGLAAAIMLLATPPGLAAAGKIGGSAADDVGAQGYYYRDCHGLLDGKCDHWHDGPTYSWSYQCERYVAVPLLGQHTGDPCVHV